MRRLGYSPCAAIVVGTLLSALYSATAFAARDDATAARDVARAFVEAGKSGDTGAFTALLTEAARAQLGAGGPAAGGPQGEYRLGDAVVAGDTAFVPVTANETGTEQTADIRMRREAGEWRIYGVALRQPDGADGFFIDFEHPEEMLKSVMGAIGDSLAAAFGTETAPARPLNPTELAAFDARWQHHGRLGGSAAAMLDSVAATVGIQSDWSQAGEAAAHPVTLDQGGRSALQVIDDIAREAGVHPVFDGGVVSLVPGPRAWPVAFSGPFMLEVTGLAEYPPYATGSIEVTLSALGLPPDVLNAMGEQSDLLTVDGAADASGNALLDPDAPAGAGGGVYGDVELRVSRTLGLRNLVQGVGSIASLEAGFTAQVPTGTETLRFDRLSSGAQVASGDVTIALSRVPSDEADGYAFEIRGASFDRVELVPLGPDGNEIDVISRSSSGSEDGSTVDITTDAEPAAFEARVVSGMGSLGYHFVLSEIPLARATEQPAAIEPARFDGAAPVTMEVKAIDDDGTFRSLHIALANHSNKAVRRVHFNMVYLDGDGGVLESFPQDQEGPAGEDADQAELPILAKPGAGAEFDATAFFMPDESKRARIDVLTVGFMDGSAWTSP